MINREKAVFDAFIATLPYHSTRKSALNEAEELTSFFFEEMYPQKEDKGICIPGNYTWNKASVILPSNRAIIRYRSPFPFTAEGCSNWVESDFAVIYDSSKDEEWKNSEIEWKLNSQEGINND